jgi:2-C-methyl-D-erythritol 4-phosphate cytidylyltransferase
MRKNVAVILAGGVGKRVGANLAKQFLEIAGKPIIAHTIGTFQCHDRVDEIAVVSQADYVDEVEKLVHDESFSKVKHILIGGAERYDSSQNAIRAYADDVNLLFHDAVRPLVTNRIINDCISALESYSVVDVAIPAVDTVIEAIDRQLISVPDKKRLMYGQTPQGFHIDVIRKAYDLALRDEHFNQSDDCGVVRQYLPDIPIYVVRGDPRNLKLTHKDDLYVIERLMELTNHESIGLDQ